MHARYSETMDESLLLLVNTARDFAMIVTDSERNVVRWSPGAEYILGWSEAEVIGRNERDFLFTPEDREKGIPDQEQEAALREGRAEIEGWHLRKDGNRCWISGVLVPLHDPDTGVLRGFGKILSDQTERKRLEEQLRASEKALRQANETLERRVQDRTAELRKALLQLEAVRGERQELFGRLSHVQEDERRRISRELHDQTGQILTAMGLELSRIEYAAQETRSAASRAGLVASNAARAASEAARVADIAATTAAQGGPGDLKAARLARVASEAARAAAIAGTDAGAAAAAAEAAMGAVDEAAPRIGQIRALVDTLSRDIHRIAVDLRPTSLDDLGLAPALDNYTEQWSQQTGIPITYECSGLAKEIRLREPVETTIYRVVQEALTNVARYGQQVEGQRVSVTLQRIEGHVQATIEDKGPGFDPDDAARSSRLGLRGMQERVALLRGTLEVESCPGGGTTLFVRIPVSSEPVTEPQVPS